MALPLNIYQNLEKLVLGTRAISAVLADSFKLYWSPVEAGPYVYIKSFPNVPDKSIYPGNALVRISRAELGVLTTDSFFLKITSVKSGSESAIGSSDLTTVPPVGAEANDEMREDITNAAQLFGYNSTTGLWQRLTTDGSGKLETTAVINLTGTGLATEAKQDAQITILNSIDAGIPAALGQTTMANSMPVVFASDQSALEILDVVDISQQTDVGITTVAVDILQAPQIAAPLVGRKLVVLQNNDARDILIGDATVQNHVLPRNGGVRSFSASDNLSVYARVSSGTATLNVWELG